MNLSEFKAWFEGFTEDMDGEPNPKQWKRIKKRVGEITSDPTPWPVYVRDYYRPFQPYFVAGVTTGGQVGLSQSNGALGGLPQSLSNSGSNQFHANAFQDLGRAEWKEVSSC